MNSRPKVTDALIHIRIVTLVGRHRSIVIGMVDGPLRGNENAMLDGICAEHLDTKRIPMTVACGDL